MTLLLSILIVLGFGLMFVAHLPGSRVPIWSAWLTWFVASILWVVTRWGVG